MPFRAIARSPPGRRTTRDDAFLVEDALALFAVADGMGAMVSGRPAADLAVDALREHHRKDRSGHEVRVTGAMSSRSRVT